MKKDLTRALNAFDAMEALPDDLILDAERALTAAESGFSLTPSKPESGFRRFLNSGWGVAAVAGIVSVIVLIIMIRAGKEPPTYEPPVKPAGSTLEMSAEGADFTLSMEQESYDEGVNRITVIMTGKAPGESISMLHGWHLERLTEEGAEVVEIYYTEEAIESGKPDKDGFATIKKTIHMDRTPLTAGTYRLHATKHDGEKYVSVAWCEFTVGIPAEQTEAVDQYGFYEGGEVFVGVYKYSPDFPEGDHGYEKIAADYIIPYGSSKFISGLSGDTIKDTQAPATLELAATDSFVEKTLYHRQSYQDKSGLYRLYADKSGQETYLFDEDGRFIEYDMPADGIVPFEDDGPAIRVACDFLLSVGVEITDAYTCTVLPVDEQNIFLHDDPKARRTTVLITRNIGGMMGEGYVVYCGGSESEPCVIYSQAVNPGMYESFGYVTEDQIGHTRLRLHEAIGLLECYVGATYRVTYEVASYDREYLVMSGNHLYLCVEFSPIMTDPDYIGTAGGGTCMMRITP